MWCRSLRRRITKRSSTATRGPNTGGMGAYCDSRDPHRSAGAGGARPRDLSRPWKRTGFTGFLYAGLMMTADGPKVLEFNVRLGDPETQPLMHRMASDFVPVLMAAAEGRLERHAPGMASRTRASAWCWRRAAIPAPSKRGSPFTASKRPRPPEPRCFMPGHAWVAAGVETAGGRVLGVTASGERSRRGDRPRLRRGARESASTACITATTLAARGWDDTMEEQWGRSSDG